MTGHADFEAFVVARRDALLRTAYLLTGDHHDAGSDSADAASDHDGNGVAWAALVVGIVAVLGSAAAIVIGLRRTGPSATND